MMRYKRITALILAILAALAMRSAGSLAAPQERMLNLAMICPADTRLMPLEIDSRSLVSILKLVYEPLVIMDDGRNITPNLAESFRYVGGNAWEFTLRQDVMFHDGSTLTAQDAVDTLNAISALAKQNQGPYREAANLLTDWEAKSEYVFRVRAKNSSYATLYAMTFPIIKGGGIRFECPPGTGPYKISFYQAGSQLLLSRNNEWWQRGSYFTALTAKWYKTDNDALAAFQMGEVDVMQTRSLNATRYRGIAGSSITSLMYSTNQLELLMFNNYSSLWGSLEMKKAISHAIDRGRLMANVYQNIAMSTDNLTPLGSAWYNDSSTVYQYNPDASNRMLDALGYTQRDDAGFRVSPQTGETLAVRLYYYDESGTTFRRDVAFMIDDMLRAVGIDCRVTYFRLENAMPKLEIGDFDMFLCGMNFSDVPDPTFFISRASDMNYSRYRSAESQDMLKKLAAASDKDDFYAIQFELQRQVSADLPVLPLFYRGGMLLMRGAFLTAINLRENDVLRTFAQANR